MDTLTLENPVFASFAIAAALMVLKLMGQGWMTVFRMIKSDAGLINPEDLRQTPFNKSPRPDQLDHKRLCRPVPPNAAQRSREHPGLLGGWPVVRDNIAPALAGQSVLLRVCPRASGA